MANRIVWEGFIALDLPPGWEYEEDHDEQLVTLYDPENGVGAFQISFGIHRKQVEDLRMLAERRMKEFVEGYGSQGSVTVTEENGNWQAHAAFSVDDHDYWEAWYWTSRAKRVFMTYNCAMADKGVERTVYQQLVASIRWV